MKDIYEIYVNEKNGEVGIKNIGEKTKSITQYTHMIWGNNTYVGFRCEKEEIPKTFDILKNREIKDRKNQINELQKEIVMFEKLNLPVLN
jgi:hypothetical protein